MNFSYGRDFLFTEWKKIISQSAVPERYRMRLLSLSLSLFLSSSPYHFPLQCIKNVGKMYLIQKDYRLPRIGRLIVTIIFSLGSFRSIWETFRRHSSSARTSIPIYTSIHVHMFRHKNKSTYIILLGYGAAALGLIFLTV
jgi:hypothetical protein